MDGVGFALMITEAGVAEAEQPVDGFVSTSETVPVPAAFQFTVMEAVPAPVAMLPPDTDHKNELPDAVVK